MTLAQFLASAIGPLVLRALAAAGIGVLSVAGVQEVIGVMIDHAQNAWSTIPAGALALIGLTGAPTALGMVFGAINARAALWVITSASRWMVKG